MKILDTSPITSAVGFPPKSGTWNFLQLAYQECVESIIRNLIGSSYSTSNGYILWGMLYSPPSSLTAGAIFYNGKIYLYAGGFVPANIVPNVTLVNIGQTQYTTNADPVLFTDGNNYNVHNIFSISLSSGTSGTGGICNLSALIRLDSYAGLRGDITTLQSDVDTLQSDVDTLQAYVDGLLSTTALGTWTTVPTLTSPWTTANGKYKKDGQGKVNFRGLIQQNSGSTPIGTLFTMPSGFRPVVDQVWIVNGQNGAGVFEPVSIHVVTSGVVQVLGTPTSGGSNYYLDLVQIEYYTT
jgi:hypothetical protein